MNKGKSIFIFGISAVGKTYYKNIITNSFDVYQLHRVLTRNKREDENQSKDIYISKDEFIKLKLNNKFDLDIKINDNYYGYLKSEISKIDDGIDIIGDCYYKLLDEIDRKLKNNNLIKICIQPQNIYYTFNLIKEKRNDYEKRIINAKNEYEYFENNLKRFDYIIYTDYNNTTKNGILDIVGNILKKK